jgi:hypothetical protein
MTGLKKVNLITKKLKKIICKIGFRGVDMMPYLALPDTQLNRSQSTSTLS